MPERLRARLEMAVAELNALPGLPAPLSLSVGVAETGPDDHATLTDLLGEADRAMYDQKRARRAARPTSPATAG